MVYDLSPGDVLYIGDTVALTVVCCDGYKPWETNEQDTKPGGDG